MTRSSSSIGVANRSVDAQPLRASTTPDQFGFTNRPTMPAEPLARDGAPAGTILAVTSSLVRPGGSSFGSRSVAIEHEGIVVRLHGGRRAGSGIEADALRALAADIFVGRLADLAFREAGDVGRNAIGDPVVHAGAAAAFRIDHQEREALGAGRRIDPGQLRRNVLADAVRRCSARWPCCWRPSPAACRRP